MWQPYSFLKRLAYLAMMILLLFHADLSAQWQKVSQQFQNGSGLDTTYLLFANGNSLFAIADSGAYLSTNEGVSWKLNNLTNTARGINVQGGYAFDDINSIVAIGQDIYAGSFNIWHSSDSGITWSLLTGKVPNDITGLATIGQRIFASSQFIGIGYSDDFGVSWNRSSIGAGTQTFYGIKSIDSFLFVYASATNGGVFRSSDDGNSWQQVSNEPGVYNQHNKGYVGIGPVFLFSGESGLFRSIDEGLTWQKDTASFRDSIFPTTFATFGPFVFGGSGAYGAPYGGAFISVDSGNAWKEISDGLPYIGSVPIKVLSLEVHNGFLFAGTAGEGVWRRPLSDFSNGVQMAPIMNSKFTVISNPISTSADFQFDALKERAVFELFDILGRSLLREQLSAGQASLHVNMQNMPAGMYFARLGGETVRFVKM